MKTVSQHVAENIHLPLAEHAAAVSKEHRVEAKRHAAMHKELEDSDPTAAAEHDAKAGHHERLADAWSSFGNQQTKCAKDLVGDGDSSATTTHKVSSNATDAEAIANLVLQKLGDQLVPTNVRAVIADNPAYAPRQTVTAVPRLGAPDLARMQGIDPEFVKFVTVED